MPNTPEEEEEFRRIAWRIETEQRVFKRAYILGSGSAAAGLPAFLALSPHWLLGVIAWLSVTLPLCYAGGKLIAALEMRRVNRG
jgi:hypothetical protein